jgi:putative tricarboxylic transport membrane protein
MNGIQTSQPPAIRLILSLGVFLLACSGPVAAAERLHFLIPAGPGGGLDSTARALGAALQAAERRSPVSFENMTGGGGGRAMAHFVETANRQQSTLLVNSTPLIIRSLQGLFPHDHRDVIPVAGLVGEYGAFVVRADSAIESWAELAQILRTDPGSVIVGGGSVRGSLDHVVLALAVRAAGIEPRRVRYLPYDAGGKAMLALLGGEIDLLSTGVGETLSYAASGDVRVLAVTAPERLTALPDTPTLMEQSADLVFANWRGVFAAPGTPMETVDAFQTDITAAVATERWAEAVARYGWSPLNLAGEDFARYLDAQAEQLREILISLG